VIFIRNRNKTTIIRSLQAIFIKKYKQIESAPVSYKNAFNEKRACHQELTQAL